MHMMSIIIITRGGPSLEPNQNLNKYPLSAVHNACLYATTLQNLEAVLSFPTPVSAKKWLQRTHLTTYFYRTL
jgi:hypothetical protein